jgi:hypothetical protein
VSLLEPILIGLLVGLVVGALGAGGGILSVPILVYALQQPPHSAAASSLVIVGFTAMTGLIFPDAAGAWCRGARALGFGGVAVAGSLLGGSRLSTAGGRRGADAAVRRPAERRWRSRWRPSGDRGTGAPRTRGDDQGRRRWTLPPLTRPALWVKHGPRRAH